jgi:hypothetical protein
MPTLTNRHGTALLAATGALMLVAFLAAPRAEASTIYACLKKKTGTAHVYTKKPKCKKGESKLSWNTEGLPGKNGANGTNGAEGKEGKAGKEGAPGQPQKAVAFNVTDNSSPTETSLFKLAEVSVQLNCFNFIANFSGIEASAPAGSHAETGMVFTNSEGKAPEIGQEPVKDVALGTSFTTIMLLSSNLKAPLANIGHINGSIATGGAVVIYDAFIQTAASPSACTVRGSAFSIPL